MPSPLTELVTPIIGQTTSSGIVKERFAHEYLDRSSISFTRRSDILYDSRTTSYTVSSSSGGYSGGRSGGFSSSRGSSGGGRSGGSRRG